MQNREPLPAERLGRCAVSHFKIPRQFTYGGSDYNGWQKNGHRRKTGGTLRVPYFRIPSMRSACTGGNCSGRGRGDDRCRAAWAGYNWGGDGMEEIASGTIPNGAVYMQSYGDWGTSYTNSSSGYSTQFTSPACDDVVNARLVLGIYGGSAYNLASPLTVTVNGVATSVTVGGGTSSPDTNPEFTASQTNVYGSMSSGAWVVSIPVTGDLNTNGSANNVNVKISSNTELRRADRLCFAVGRLSEGVAEQHVPICRGRGQRRHLHHHARHVAIPTVASRWVDLGAFNTSKLAVGAARHPVHLRTRRAGQPLVHQQQRHQQRHALGRRPGRQFRQHLRAGPGQFRRDIRPVVE